MIVLAATANGSIRSLLPDGRDALFWHGSLVAEMTAHLSPAHAAILAIPVRGGSEIVWQASATASRRYAELSTDERAALMRAVGVILSDIRRLAESGVAPAVARCWPALREIPDLGMMYAADGRPVLVAWGAVPAIARMARGVLADADDRRPFRASPRSPWGVYALALASLAVLALAAELLLPLLGWPRTAVAACVADPADLAALNAQAREDGRHSALMAELARLVGQEGTRRLECPIPPGLGTPPARSGAIAPPALPQDAWNRRDLAMLSGCWTKISNLHVVRESTGQVRDVANWKLCFDAHGGGTQTLVLSDGAPAPALSMRHFKTIS
ncbi:MAG TPA: hypothetical protein VGC09_00620 [Rhodopila sp.]